MMLTLNEQEIERAIAKYVKGKNTSDSPHHNYVVKIHWRGEPPRAEVTITKKDETPAGASVPTLSDKVSGG